MECAISKPLMLSGRYFSKKELRQVQETVKMFPNLSRTELAFTICEHLSWVTPKGSDKINSCLDSLELLENRGYIQLPLKQIKKKRVTKKIVWSDKTVEGSQILCSLEEITPLEPRDGGRWQVCKVIHVSAPEECTRHIVSYPLLDEAATRRKKNQK